MLFYDENAHLNICPTCESTWYKDEGQGSNKSNVTTSKVLRYFLIIPMLQRVFMSRKTMEYMSWHKVSTIAPRIIINTSQGQTWKHLNSTFPDFAPNLRNVRLSLCANAFSQFGYLVKSYLIWPIVLTVYNLLLQMCTTKLFLLLTLLIPSPRSPKQNIDVHIRPLIYDLCLIWESKILTQDVSMNMTFQMRVALL